MLFFKRKERPQAAQHAGSIYCDPVSTNARAIFAEAGMRLVETPDEADLLWMRKGYKPWLGRLNPGQLLSHLPFEQAMTDKGLLAEHLHAHARAGAEGGLALQEFYRETCCLYRDVERESFVRQLPAVDTPDNLWIYKPARSSRGRGIRIAWQFDDLRAFDAANPTSEQQALIAERTIVQRYIRNPLLLEGRKSEIRVYWLIASLEPLKVLVFDEGTVRLNSLPFKLDDFDNTLVHVTNVYQQKHHPDYDPTLVLKWSFAEWERYLVEDLHLAQPGFIANALLPHIRQILAFVVRASAASLGAGLDPRNYFGLYGADIILDDQLRPWLTEIQKGPGISFDDPVKRVLIPAVLRETVEIMQEVRQCRDRNELPAELKARKRFQWVIS